MPKGTRYTPEQIISKLREAEVAISKGDSAAAAAKTIGVAEQTFYRWRKEYGGLRTDQAKRLKALEKENARLKWLLADAELEKQSCRKPCRETSEPDEAMSSCRDALGRDHVSERRACRILGQPRSTQRREKQISSGESRLVKRMVELATEYGRYGYRRITALLRAEGGHINHKRIERLWRQEGLKVPQKQPKRKRLWLADGSCVRLRPPHKDHIWSYDFVADRTSDGRKFRIS